MISKGQYSCLIRRGKSGAGKIFEEIMADDFSNLMRYKYRDPRSSMNPKQIN